jgi:hypothetical protein
VEQTKIAPGGDWRHEIQQGLDQASAFIVLPSQDYRSRSFCMQLEIKPILNKVRAGQARCIGIALHLLVLDDFRVVDDEDGSWLSMARLQCLPQDMGDVDGRRRRGLVPMSQWP